MKKIKVISVVALLAMVTAVNAQVSLGIKGGVNMSNFWGDELTDKNLKMGFHGGIATDFEVTPGVAIQSGLFFTTKGAKFEKEYPVVGKVEFTSDAYYLQLPLYFAYKVDVMPGTRIAFHAGPYAAYGIGGKQKVKNQWTDALRDVLGKPEMNTFDKDHGFKPFDAGIGFGVGAEFSHFLIDLGWDMGLVNISQSEKGNIKNQNAYLSVGFKF